MALAMRFVHEDEDKEVFLGVLASEIGRYFKSERVASNNIMWLMEKGFLHIDGDKRVVVTPFGNGL